MNEKELNKTLFDVAYDGNEELAKILIKEGVNINTIINSLFETPLFIAVKRNKKNIVKLLLENGADVNSENIYGLTPLYYAISDNNVEIVELLVKSGANINIEDFSGRSPLYYASLKDNQKIIELLKKY